MEIDRLRDDDAPFGVADSAPAGAADSQDAAEDGDGRDERATARVEYPARVEATYLDAARERR